MDRNSLLHLLKTQLSQVLKSDKQNIYYLLYYSFLEAVLLMISPLASAFIINSVLSHATVSIMVLALVVIVIFFGIAFLQIIKEYIIEKFEQKIFVENAINVAKLAKEESHVSDAKQVDKYMNYFFDVISIQKLFPTLVLNGSGLFVKIVVSLVLLLIFDPSLFVLGVLFIIFFGIIVLYLGRYGAEAAVERSNAKHEAIYYLQTEPFDDSKSSQSVYEGLDKHLNTFVQARKKMFSIIIRQLSLTFMMEGLLLSSFFILGGYLVFEGLMPIGEFVAAEIIVISVAYALRDFMKQIDYLYEMVEGFYKIDRLSKTLKES
ncbi:MAG: ABC transporter ATP-binding protein [Sulfurovum sp.]|nr:ABC transporter ATP-binding protein [Sulfurovum sp.]